MNRRCARKGHKWRQKVTYMLGPQRCIRWGCDAERVDPSSLPTPEEWATRRDLI